MRTFLVVSAVAVVTAIAGVSAAAAAGPQQTVTATLISRPAHTLAPGSTVNASKIFGHRVFNDAKHGFALVDTGQAQYPAASTDGGKTWKTDGPALHLNAAQAPLAVIYIGIAGVKTIFAWGTGQVIDSTSDGGQHWYRAVFFGLPVAVIRNPQGHLVAFVDGETSGSNATLQYVSKNGGRTWRLDNAIGGS
jgi:BNR/Asp-box repeat